MSGLRHPHRWARIAILWSTTWALGATLPFAPSTGEVAAQTTKGSAGALGSTASPLFALSGPGAVLELTLSAPFASLLNQAADDEEPVAGRLAYRESGSGRTIDVGTVQIEARGNTSRRASECDFPKLTLDLPGTRDGAHAAPLFDGLRSVKLGTHCASRADGDLTPLGRWANQKAAFREALAYRLLGAAGVPALLARPARVTYRFSDGGHDALTRDALLLETDASAARRLTGTNDRVAQRQFTSAADFFDEADLVRLHFGQAMIGNFDWCLRLTPDDTYRCAGTHPLWNLLAVARPGGTSPRALPVVQDLDLAGTVVGRHPWFAEVFDRDALPGAPDHEIEVVAQLQHARARFSRPALDAGRAAFRAREPAVRAALAEAPVDDHGRTLARDYLDAFFHHLADDSFLRPVVVRDQTLAFSDATDPIPLCKGEALKRGTPVTVTAHANARSQVRILDVEWQWAPPRTCDAVTRGAFWIESAAIGRDFPR